MEPRIGPQVYVVPGISRVDVPALGSLGPVVFRFPRALFVTGFRAVPTSGSSVDLAALSLRIQDESFQDVISDGQGSVFAGSLGALSGTAGMTGWEPLCMLRTFMLQRPVLDGDTWLFTVSNRAAAIKQIELLLYFEEGTRP